MINFGSGCAKQLFLFYTWYMQEECRFNTEKQKHVILLPGLLAPVQSLFPLVRYVRNKQTEYAVTAIPLGLSLAGFDSIVARATKTIVQNLLQHNQPTAIILFGHSHGGRVACEVVAQLKKISSATEYSVVTAGTPMGEKWDYLSWLNKMLFSLSKAYREWPSVTQPNSTIVRNYVGYYSTSDQTVIPAFAKNDYRGELIELQGLSHRDLISPTKIGPILLEL